MSHQFTLIVGYLGRDPEMDYTASGQARTRFSVATNRKYKDPSGEEVKETTWFNVTAWGKQAETCNAYLHKGSQVLVQGRLVPDPDTGSPHIWSRHDGTPASSFEVSAETVRFLGANNGNGSEVNAVAQKDEIPF
jgi:single-strand DNA-binding protein